MRHNEILETFTKLNKPIPKQREIAEALGYDVGVIGKRASRNSEYSLEERLFLSEHFKINLVEEKQNLRLVSQEEDCISIDYYPDVFGSCGNGAFVLSETKEKMQVPKTIVEYFSKVKKYSAINAIGDSMLPYINDRDILIVEHYEREQIRDNRIYVFRYGDNIFVKRLVYNVNQIVVKSDNQEYRSIIIEKQDMNEFQIIGQIVGLMRSTR